MKIKDGGSAFPDQGQKLLLNGQWSDSWSPGMTLRDWFAGMAMQGALAAGFKDGAGRMDWHYLLATGAYQIADMMLAAREATE